MYVRLHLQNAVAIYACYNMHLLGKGILAAVLTTAPRQRNRTQSFSPDSSMPLTEQVDRIHRSGLGQVRDVLSPVVRVTAESVDKDHRRAVASLLQHSTIGEAVAGGRGGRDKANKSRSSSLH